MVKDLRLGWAIRIAREAKGMKQTELAAGTKVDRSMISLVEQGKRDPSMETLEAVARVLEMPLPLLMALAGPYRWLTPTGPTELAAVTSMAVLRWLMEARMP